MKNNYCKPYIIRHLLGGKTEYVKFDNHEEYNKWLKLNKNWNYSRFEYYEYCHRYEFMNKFRIYMENLKFPFNIPKQIN